MCVDRLMIMHDKIHTLLNQCLLNIHDIPFIGIVHTNYSRIMTRVSIWFCCCSLISGITMGLLVLLSVFIAVHVYLIQATLGPASL